MRIARFSLFSFFLLRATRANRSFCSFCKEQRERITLVALLKRAKRATRAIRSCYSLQKERKEQSEERKSERANSSPPPHCYKCKKTLPTSHSCVFPINIDYKVIISFNTKCRDLSHVQFPTFLLTSTVVIYCTTPNTYNFQICSFKCALRASPCAL